MDIVNIMRNGGGTETLHELINRLQAAEALENPDRVVAMNTLTMNNNGNIVTPVGELRLTDWSQTQLATMVGLRWDRWFQNADQDDKADELNRRFRRATSEVKIRTTRAVEPGVAADGTLSALVTPGYTAVRDSMVAGLVIESLRGLETGFEVLRSDFTTRSSSYVVALGRPFVAGGNREVGDHYGGLLVRNSGVGYASLRISVHLIRLICRNGMTAPVKDAQILRRYHRGLMDESRILEQLDAGLLDLPEKLKRSEFVISNAAWHVVDDVPATIECVIGNAKLPKRVAGPVIEAYGKEPLPSAFGVVQAFTLAAQQFAPEERLQLEDAASEYLRNMQQ